MHIHMHHQPRRHTLFILSAIHHEYLALRCGEDDLVFHQYAQTNFVFWVSRRKNADEEYYTGGVGWIEYFISKQMATSQSLSYPFFCIFTFVSESGCSLLA
jgi:hypothetical protein